MQVNNWIPMTDEDWEWVNGKTPTPAPIKK
jgi:hypothetical protein